MFGIFRGATFQSLLTPLTYLTGNAVLLAVYQTLVENKEVLLPGWLQVRPSPSYDHDGCSSVPINSESHGLGRSIQLREAWLSAKHDIK